MERQNIGRKFADLRRRANKTMLAVSEECGLSETVVWHLEHNWPIRWESVHAILTMGLGIPQGTRDYEAMHALWLKDRQDRAEKSPASKGKRTLSKHAVEATARFRDLVRNLNPEQTKKVIRAAERAAKSL